MGSLFFTKPELKAKALDYLQTLENREFSKDEWWVTPRQGAQHGVSGFLKTLGIDIEEYPATDEDENA